MVLRPRHGRSARTIGASLSATANFRSGWKIVFTADVPSDSVHGGRLLLSAPVLVDLPVEQTLWSVTAASAGNSAGSRAITGSTSRGGSMAVVGAAPATAIHQDLVRLQTISQLLDSVASAPAAGPDDQNNRWFAPWSHRFQVARGAVDRRLVREGSIGGSPRGRRRSQEDRRAAIQAEPSFGNRHISRRFTRWAARGRRSRSMFGANPMNQPRPSRASTFMASVRLWL